jgi:hypothetical protein
MRSQATICLLPYNPTQYWPWFPVEAGLKALIGAARCTVIQPETGSAQGQLSATTSAWVLHPITRKEHFLEVDMDNVQVTLDGKALALGNREAAVYMTALLKAEGEWAGPSKIEELCPGFQGARPDRIKKKLPDPIKPFVKTKKGNGSRLLFSRHS